jgi:twitching motility protein PilT
MADPVLERAAAEAEARAEAAGSQVTSISKELRKPKGDGSLNKFFKTCIKMKVSDLHLKAGRPPYVRVRGDLKALDHPPLTDERIRKGIFELLNDEQIEHYKHKGAIDFAYDVGPQGDADRFRVNAFQQRGKMSVAARRVNREIKKFSELYLPESLAKIAEFQQGMVLLAGITGSGKSTTIASMIDYVNERYPVHMVTIEDPIEYLFTDKKAVINQREIGIDCDNFHDALKYLMREDPDVVLVGEMRDIETFTAAVHAAETGHLVFGTIHASSAAQTISRILDLFPESGRKAIRQALVFNLKTIIAQKLLPCVKEDIPVVPTCEIMISNPAIRKLIEEERDAEITNVMRANYDAGMIDFTEHLRQLVENGFIDHETAYEAAPNPDELKMALKGIRTGSSSILG